MQFFKVFSIQVISVCYFFGSFNALNDLRSAEGKLNQVELNFNQQKSYANCINIEFQQREAKEFFMGESFKNMKVLGSGNFGEVREPKSNNNKPKNEQVVFKRTGVKFGEIEKDINEFYYWRFIQNKKNDIKSGLYKSKSFPEYYGCAYK